jgi:large subunit ribosomal protein L6
MHATIELPDDVSASVDGLDVRVEGPEGVVERQLWYPDVTVTVDGDAIRVESDNEDAKTKSTVGTFESHLENAVRGVREGFTYEMEVRYEHFPMQVRVDGDEVVIENFLGEKSPRRTKILGDTDVEVDGEQLVITGPDKEAVGQTAGSIREATRVTDKDTRVFEDGVYVTERPEATHG